jgi:hypothetical protein
MPTWAKICRWAGHAWIVLAAIVIVYFWSALSALQETPSPFLLLEFATFVIVMAPGVALVKLGDYLNERVDPRQ